MSTSAARTSLLPFASHRDLYLLVVGVLLGVLLSPAVLGRLSPQTHEYMFRGGGQVTARVQAKMTELNAELARLEASGVSDVALREHEDQARVEILPLQLRQAVEWVERDRTLTGWMTALIVATLIIMVIESLVTPRPVTADAPRAVVPAAVGRLITVRYAMLALWIALALARPTSLSSLPVVFTVLLVAVALAAAFVPLGPGKGETPANADEHGWE